MISKSKSPKKWKLFSVLLACIMLILWTAFPAKTAKAAPVVTLRLGSAWFWPDMGNYKLREFVDRINKEAKSVRIEFKGGPEAIPAFEGLDYIRRGIVDLYHTTPAYYAGTIPDAMTVFPIVASPSAMRESGYLKLFDNLHREKAGLTTLGQLWRGDPFALFLNKPIERADFTGLKLRSTPLYLPFFRALGAACVTLPMADVYSSVQRGVVDGFGYSYGPNFLELKLEEVVKYVVNPVIPYESCAVLLANVKVWDALPEESKKEILDIVQQMEPGVYEWYKYESMKPMEKLFKDGRIKVIQLPPAEAKKFFTVAKDTLWAEIATKGGLYTEQLKALAIKAEELGKK